MNITIKNLTTTEVIGALTDLIPERELTEITRMKLRNRAMSDEQLIRLLLIKCPRATVND